MAGADLIVRYLQDLGVDRAGEPTLPGQTTRVQEARVGAPGVWQLWLFSWFVTGANPVVTRYWEIRATDIGTQKVLAIGEARDVMISTWGTLYAELLKRADYPVLALEEP
jgi:hypothetical protein